MARLGCPSDPELSARPAIALFSRLSDAPDSSASEFLNEHTKEARWGTTGAHAVASSFVVASSQPLAGLDQGRAGNVAIFYCTTISVPSMKFINILKIEYYIVVDLRKSRFLKILDEIKSAISGLFGAGA